MSSTRNRRRRVRRAGVVAALVALACTTGGWTLQSCDEQPGDGGPRTSGCDGPFCVAAGERCKFGVRNIRHRYFAGAPQGSATEIYFGGQRTTWCWVNANITKRHTDFPLGWTSVVGSGSVTHSTYSSNCSSTMSTCLVREDFLARLEATVPVIGLPIGINERFCVGTRIYSGGSHVRNISNGTCPGNSASLASAGLVGFAGVSATLERQITKLAFSLRNLRRMARTGRPLPALNRMLGRAYRQLSPAQKRKLRSRARFCIARLGTTCGKGV